METQLEFIERAGAVAVGKKELIKYVNGESLTPRESLLANCYMCTGYYADGRIDCKTSNCPVYPYMPYSSKPAPKKKMSEKAKKAAIDRFAKARKDKVKISSKSQF